MMDFRAFFSAMSGDEQDRYAQRCGSTGNYMRQHYLNPGRPRKIPRREAMDRMIEAANGAVSREEMLIHFYPPQQHKGLAA